MCEQKRHEWADVIHAYAEGKDIQYRNKSIKGHSWVNSKTITSIDYEYLEWRIKPEKKTYWVNVYKYNKDDMRMGTGIFRSEKEAKYFSSDINYIKTISFEVEE